LGACAAAGRGNNLEMTTLLTRAYCASRFRWLAGLLHADLADIHNWPRIPARA
jgi:hypothetical protein